MQYLLLIYSNEADDPQPGTPAFDEMIAGFEAFDKALEAKDAMRGGNALKPVSTATTVKVRNGKTVTTDGPFAETKEVLGGYYVIEADNLDTALEFAAKIPCVTWGSVEVRPIMTYD
ncbi:MAG: YciI family protein [Pseudobacteriovorax sp.]|nr:YciI family protein [Pseudobacteriovorax sp.]